MKIKTPQVKLRPKIKIVTGFKFTKQLQSQLKKIPFNAEGTKVTINGVDFKYIHLSESLRYGFDVIQVNDYYINKLGKQTAEQVKSKWVKA